ncbi:MAG: chaperone modulator CbpM [Gammaproteobacteria bacterium]|nr:chaperone modulator CbpM [Gammaproteobacteria bacterium]
MNKLIILNGTLLDEQTELSLNELCCACSRPAEWVIELVEEGALEPVEREPMRQLESQWRFTADSLQRARTAMRLQRDLNINMAGIALALDLLEEVETLQARLRRYEMSAED